MSEPLFLELEIPEGVHEAEQAVEVFRTWIADGAMHVTFNPEAFGNEIGEWGRLMADCLQHIAAGVAMTGQMDKAEAMAAIQAAFERGMQEGGGEEGQTRTGKIKRVQH